MYQASVGNVTYPDIEGLSIPQVQRDRRLSCALGILEAVLAGIHQDLSWRAATVTILDWLIR